MGSNLQSELYVCADRHFLIVFFFCVECRAYINLAAELGLWVILRPGPYISSELDLGGLPR